MLSVFVSFRTTLSVYSDANILEELGLPGRLSIHFSRREDATDTHYPHNPF